MAELLFDSDREQEDDEEVDDEVEKGKEDDDDDEEGGFDRTCLRQAVLYIIHRLNCFTSHQKIALAVSQCNHSNT
jgi:hypothetical protein